MFETFKNRLRQPRGIQFFKYIAVGGAIFIGVALIYPTFLGCRDCGHGRARSAMMRMKQLAAALELYAYDLNTYPPNPSPETTSGKILWLYLTQELESNGKIYRGYTEPFDDKIHELVSPLRGNYEYRTLNPDKEGKPRYVLVDPGPDQKLGGYIDPEKGFVKTSDEADDNLIGSATRE